MNYKITKTSDTDINEVLISRNMKFNRIKMINTNMIEKIDHYIWWFSNNRENYKLTINNHVKVFFWQEIIKIKKNRYLVGGWHSNIKKINLFHVLYLLKWQLKRNAKKNVNFDWIAVVKKNNKWILKLTQMIGYTKVKGNAKLYSDIKTFFKVSDDEYYFLHFKIN
tara:strand:- start:364 stop:861 length:498 start_codon:yes stop_codon:yes gene_type:complete